MSKKNRYVNTKFWSDNYIVELDPLERYLFLYFLTNEHTNIAGVYELPMRTMAFETGLKKDMLDKMLPRFKGKIYYIKGWVYIKNFARHQKTTSEKVQIGIQNVLNDTPEDILAKISQIDIGYNKGIDRVCIESELLKPKLKPIPNSNLNLNSNSNLNNIYVHFQKNINLKSKLTDKAKDKIKLRLKTFSENEILKAINNFSKDNWCMDHNSSRGVAWFFHTDERIDQFINLKPKKQIKNYIK